MVTHMKTTIDLSDALLREAKRRAQARGLTLRALVEEGLRLVLKQEGTTRRFRLRRATFRGRGRAPETESWPAVREHIYRGQGG